MTRYPSLPDSLKAQLSTIEPSRCGNLEYYPCEARLLTGETVDRVYVVAEAPYISLWGVYPEQDKGKFWISIADVTSIRESTSRLPARFATQLYEAGESGMGYQIFTVVFTDGTKQAYVTGNAVDFLEYPVGKSLGDIKTVLPHIGRDQNPRQAPKYYWCLYSDGEVPLASRPMPIERPKVATRIRNFWRRCV